MIKYRDVKVVKETREKSGQLSLEGIVGKSGIATILLLDNSRYKNKRLRKLQRKFGDAVVFENIDNAIEAISNKGYGMILASTEIKNYQKIRDYTDAPIVFFGSVPKDQESSFIEVIGQYDSHYLGERFDFRGIEETIRGILQKEIEVLELRKDAELQRVLGSDAPDLVIEQAFRLLNEGGHENIEKARNQLTYVLKRLPTDVKAAEGMIRIFGYEIEKEPQSPNVEELRLIATERLFRLKPDPELGKLVATYLLKRYEDGMRCLLEANAYKELAKDRTKEVTNGLSKRDKIYYQNIPRIQLPKILGEPLDIEGTYYLAMEHIRERGPHYSDISPQIEKRIRRGDKKALEFKRRTGFRMNEFLAYLQVNPIETPEDIPVIFNDFSRNLNRTFVDNLQFLNVDFSNYEVDLLRYCVSAINRGVRLETWSSDDWIQYFDFNGTNILFPIEKEDATFDDLLEYGRSRGLSIDGLVDSIFTKIDYNKINLMTHPLEDRRHESSRTPYTDEERELFDIHFLLQKERYKILDLLHTERNWKQYKRKLDRINKGIRSLEEGKISPQNKRIKRFISPEKMSQLLDDDEPYIFFYREFKWFDHMLTKYTKRSTEKVRRTFREGLSLEEQSEEYHRALEERELNIADMNYFIDRSRESLDKAIERLKSRFLESELIEVNGRNAQVQKRGKKGYKIRYEGITVENNSGSDIYSELFSVLEKQIEESSDKRLEDLLQLGMLGYMRNSLGRIGEIDSDKINYERLMEKTLLDKVKKYVFKKFPNVEPETYLVPHLKNTWKWVLRLMPDASEALQIAALRHDGERIKGTVKSEDYTEEEYGSKEEAYAAKKRVHAEESARIVCRYLKSKEAPQRLRDEVEFLVTYHEGGEIDKNHYLYKGLHKEVDVLTVADTASFLEDNLSTYIEVHRDNLDDIEFKIDFMWKRLPEEYKVSLRSRYANALYTLGLAYEKSGDLEKATDMWDRVLNNQPKHPEALLKVSI